MLLKSIKVESKKHGLSGQPCLTPMPHENRADSPSVGCITLTLSWLYMLCKHCMKRPTIPILANTCHSRSQGTVSKALRKSTKQQYIFLCLWALCSMSVRKMYRLFVVRKSFLKPAYPLARKPLSSAQLLNHASRIMANTLTNIRPIVIPL